MNHLWSYVNGGYSSRKHGRIRICVKCGAEVVTVQIEAKVTSPSIQEAQQTTALAYTFRLPCQQPQTVWAVPECQLASGKPFPKILVTKRSAQ